MTINGLRQLLHLQWTDKTVAVETATKTLWQILEDDICNPEISRENQLTVDDVIVKKPFHPWEAREVSKKI